MRMWQRLVFGGVLSGLLFCTAGCASKQAHRAHGMPGSDRDAHGCIGSAGYTWSAACGECIRIFEKGVRLESVSGTKSGSAYLVFAPDSACAELFFSNEDRRPLLDRSSVKSGIWKKGRLRLFRTSAGWALSRSGEIRYRQVTAE